MNDELVSLKRIRTLCGIPEGEFLKQGRQRGASRLQVIPDSQGRDSVCLADLSRYLIQRRMKGGRNPADVTELARSLRDHQNLLAYLFFTILPPTDVPGVLGISPNDVAYLALFPIPDPATAEFDAQLAAMSELVACDSTCLAGLILAALQKLSAEKAWDIFVQNL